MLASADAPPGRPTQDAQLLSPPTEEPITFTSSDPWRVLRIQGEFVEGFETLATTRKAITIFGSARVKPGHPQYQAAVEVARLLGEAGYAIITGGGPGIMEAGNRGAKLAGVPSIGLNIELPFEQGSNRFVDVPVDFTTSSCARRCSSVRRASSSSLAAWKWTSYSRRSLLIQTGKTRTSRSVIGFALLEWLAGLDTRRMPLRQIGL